MSQNRSILLFIFLSCIIQLSGCSSSETTTIKHKSEVEIAPGKWLILERKSEVYTSDLEVRKNPHQLTPLDAIKQVVGSAADSGSELKELESEFSFDWNGKRVEWRGKEIPVTLREHEGMLYMIGFNREDQNQCRLIFFKLNKKETGFETIKPNSFPPQIATQNMWLSLRLRYVKIYDSIAKKEYIVDEWQMLRTLDINSIAFDRSFTAAMWYQIENGTEYEQIRYNSLLTPGFLEAYVEKYKPIALPTIVREPPADSGPRRDRPRK